MARHQNPRVRRRCTPALALVVGSLGVVVGTTDPAAADPPPSAAGNVLHGFIGPKLPITGTNLSGTNNRGEIIGVYEDRSRVLRDFLRTRGGRYRIIDPPGSFSDEEAVSINDRGNIVGDYQACSHQKRYEHRSN
jgi:hypothetical protein